MFRPRGLTINKTRTLTTALAVLALCSYGITPAMAQDHRNHGYDHGRDVRHDRGDYRGRHDAYFYAAPVYAPPVYVAPPPSPGVSLFFPLDIRVR